MRTTTIIKGGLGVAVFYSFLVILSFARTDHCAPGDSSCTMAGPSGKTPAITVSDLWNGGRPDGHAPIGVMGDHTHRAGGWMLSYRYMYMEMGDFRDGRDDVSSQDIFDRGYMVAPTGMEMHMHMFGLMYAPTDSLTLMLMGNYQKRSMDHLTRPGSMARMMRGERFRNSVDGWGDLSLSGLLKVYDANRQRIHLTLGLSFPVGETSDLFYPMQLSTGTWDLLPAATWLWQQDTFSGGAQVNGRIHLGDNDFGYSYGDRIEGTTWLAYRVSDWISLSGRLSLEYISRIDGVDERIGRIMAPPMEASNSGGTFAEAGIGVNFYFPDTALKGNRLAVELLLPFYQDVKGLQMKRDWGIVAGLQVPF